MALVDAQFCLNVEAVVEADDVALEAEEFGRYGQLRSYSGLSTCSDE